MKIVLTSSGIDKRVYREIRSLLNNKFDISVAFITSSVKYQNDPGALTARLREISDSLTAVGFIKADGYYLASYASDNLLSALREYDVVYLFGGNAFNLLNTARKVGLEKVLDKLKGEKIIVGQSAGGYILCPNIIMATWKGSNNNEVGLQDLSGFGYVPFLVSAHYSEAVSTLIKDGARESGVKIYALEDGQAIVINNDNISFIGEPIILN